jgi:DNA-binding NarL/FixJ family response regulator
MTKLRLLVVEDEGLYRELLVSAFSKDPEMEVVAEAPNGRIALEMARKVDFNVAVLDIDLGEGPNGIQVATKIKRQKPEVGILILSNHKDKQYLASLPMDVAAGWSYLLKKSVASFETLKRAVKGAAYGLVVLDPAVVQGLKPGKSELLGRLTPRQLEVLGLMAQGYTNAAIAERLVLVEKSVENYINAIYQELRISSKEDERVHQRVKAVLVYLRESSG